MEQSNASTPAPAVSGNGRQDCDRPGKLINFNHTVVPPTLQPFCKRLADKVEDERRRIEEQARVLDDAISDIDVEPENVRVAAENALDTCLTLSRLLDVLDRHADFLLDLDEALRRIGGVE
jgi:uncharacterized protein (UPF0147 family)